MYGSTVTKYKFLFISLASISIPFLEFINFNLNNLEPSQFKTLVYTMVFFIFFLFFFSFIFSILFRKNFFEIFFVCAIATYISFNYDKLKLLIISLLIKNTSFTFVGELSLILVFIIVITIVLFFFNKKNSPFFNFIYIYIIVLFIINAAGIAYNKKKLNEIPYQKAFSDEVYFTDDEVKKILDSNNNKNIYYIIVDNAIPLKQYSNNFRKIDEKKIISDFKKLNFNYIADVVPSYSATSIANAQIFNLNYFINEDSPTRPYYTVYPYIMSQFKKSPLGKTLEKINYDFFWVGNARMHCTYYNVFLCMPAKKKENLFKSIMPNILHKINTNYVLLSFLQKSPIVDFLSKLFSGKLDKNSVKEIAYIENDAIKKFIKFSKDLEINNKKNHFVFIHSLLPAPYFVPKDDPLVFNADCSLRTLSKNLQLFGKDIRKAGRPLFGYETNYICMLKRVKEFVEFIRVYDSEAMVIIQGDSGLDSQKLETKEVVLVPKTFTLVKTSKECKRHLSDQIDNINAIRLLLSCATNQKVKLLKKKSFRALDGKLFLFN